MYYSYLRFTINVPFFPFPDVNPGRGCVIPALRLFLFRQLGWTFNWFRFDSAAPNWLLDSIVFSAVEYWVKKTFADKNDSSSDGRTNLTPIERFSLILQGNQWNILLKKKNSYVFVCSYFHCIFARVSWIILLKCKKMWQYNWKTYFIFILIMRDSEGISSSMRDFIFLVFNFEVFNVLIFLWIKSLKKNNWKLKLIWISQ